MRKLTVGQFIKEIEALEPKNIIDYIFKGSGLNQWMRKEHGDKPRQKSNTESDRSW